MKRLPFVLACVVCLQSGLAAEPTGVPAPPFGIEVPNPEREEHLPVLQWVPVWRDTAVGLVRGFRIRDVGPRLIFLGPSFPLHLDYDFPLPEVALRPSKYSPVLDAPGPGYREQRARLYGP